MPTLSIHTVRNLQEFAKFLEDRLSKPDSYLWFRGCGQAGYCLIPSLYRHPTLNRIEALLEIESKILVRFKQRSIPYLTRALVTDWEYLFFMQHFGIPTRLLDWTENPHVALYFALTVAQYQLIGASGSYIEDAAIWVLNPVAWNQKVLTHIGYTGGILSVSDSEARGYAPLPEISLMPSEPIAIYGAHNSPRIIAQRGVFTICGKNLEPMEKIYEVNNFPQDSLIKLVIPKTEIERLLHSLVAIGYHDSAIFPDLDGLAKETRRIFGYKV